MCGKVRKETVIGKHQCHERFMEITPITMKCVLFFFFNLCLLFVCL